MNSLRLSVLGFAGLLALGARGVDSNAPGPTMVLLVRHAEKAAEPAQDPPLTAAGEARARALAMVAKDAGVTAVITTQYARTRRTAEPTAAAAGVSPEVVRGGPVDQHARAVADAVRRHRGATVLVVGHSNTIPAIVGALGAPRPPDLCDAEYDALFVVVLAEGEPTRLVRSRFGLPTPVGADCAPMMAR